MRTFVRLRTYRSRLQAYARFMWSNLSLEKTMKRTASRGTKSVKLTVTWRAQVDCIIHSMPFEAS